MTFEWTKAAVKKLRVLCLAGMSNEEIAAEIGVPSRNAVAGKVHRLGLPRARLSGFKKAKPIDRETVISEQTQPVSIVDLEAFHCRAVLDQVDDRGLHMYCGGIRLRDRPYCLACTRRFTLPPRDA